MALWSLLGERKVEMLAWESFGSGWVTDVIKQLKIDADVKTCRLWADCRSGFCRFRERLLSLHGTVRPQGVRVPNGDWIADDRQGLTICDATSAAFAMDLPWDKLDVTTFSWQKVLGGEAAHGMLILSARVLWSG